MHVVLFSFEFLFSDQIKPRRGSGAGSTTTGSDAIPVPLGACGSAHKTWWHHFIIADNSICLWMELCRSVSLISPLLCPCMTLFIYYRACVSLRFMNNTALIPHAPLGLTGPVSHFGSQCIWSPVGWVLHYFNTDTVTLEFNYGCQSCSSIRFKIPLILDNKLLLFNENMATTVWCWEIENHCFQIIEVNLSENLCQFTCEVL